jgi:DNA-binding NtrC family response regulator
VSGIPAPEPPDAFRRILELALDFRGAPAGESAEGPDLEDDAALLEAALEGESEPPGPAATLEGPPEPLSHFLSRATRAYVTEVLRRAGGRRAEAARLLGIDRTTLYRLMKRHGIAG